MRPRSSTLRMVSCVLAFAVMSGIILTACGGETPGTSSVPSSTSSHTSSHASSSTPQTTPSTSRTNSSSISSGSESPVPSVSSAPVAPTDADELVVKLDYSNFDEEILNAARYSDVNDDGYLNKGEIAQRKVMRFSGRIFSSFQGLEYFTSLTTLEIHGAMRELDCDGNKNTHLDLSKNTALRSLTVSGVKDLKSVDYSSCIELEELTFGSAEIANVDLSRCPKLKSLDLSWNHAVTNLNLSGNPELEKLELEGTTSLESLDISNNPNLTSLNIMYTGIKTLDASHNPKLQKIVCDDDVVIIR